MNDIAFESRTKFPFLTKKQKNYRDSAPLSLSLVVQVFRR